MAPTSPSQHKKHPHSNTPHYTMMTRALAAAQKPVRVLHAEPATPIENVEAVISSLLQPNPRDMMRTSAPGETAFSSPLGVMIRQAFYSHATPSGPSSSVATTLSDAIVLDFRRSAQGSSAIRNVAITG